MKAYKLTDQNNKSYNNTIWGQGITHRASGEGDLCSNGWLHFYEDPRLAVIFNSIHAGFIDDKMKLWEAKAEGEIINDGTKCGCTKLTTIKEIPIPEVTADQSMEFA